MMIYVLLIEGGVLLGMLLVGVLSGRQARLLAVTPESRSASRVRSLVLGLGVVAIAVGLACALVFLIPSGQDFLVLLLLNRWGLLLAGLLAGWPVLALFGLPTLLRGMLALRGPAQMFHLTWLTILTACAVIVTCEVATANAYTRGYLETIALTENAAGAGGAIFYWHSLYWAALFLLALPLPVACIWITAIDRPQSIGKLLAGFAFGIVFALVLLALGALTQVCCLQQDRRIKDLFPFTEAIQTHLPDNAPLRFLGDGLQLALNLLGPGYSDEQEPAERDSKPHRETAGERVQRKLRNLHIDEKTIERYHRRALHPTGHAQVALCLLFALAVYLSQYAVYALILRRPPDRRSWFPPVYFIVLVFVLAGVTLQGLTFWLDYVRLPPLLAVIAFSYAMSWVTRTDFFFDLNPPRENTPPVVPVTPRMPDPIPAVEKKPLFVEIVQALRLPTIPGPQGGRTLVCVTAAGGGIHAAAWAARVLTGLHERYPHFTPSVALISAVSGGSVGAMYYLDAWEDAPGTFTPRALLEKPGPPQRHRPRQGSIRGNAEASSLEAACWGLAFPDFLRVAFPPLVDVTSDRGAAVERDWARQLRDPDIRLGAWGRRMRAGQLPAVVFNATIGETGQRMLLSPFLLDPRPRDATAARELLELYPASDLRVTTAARLSAAFPYVSPMSRPLECAGVPARDLYHFCDGGYLDNEGLVTVVEALNVLLRRFPTQEGRPFDRVLIVRIEPFPRLASPDAASGESGWRNTLIGPLEALANVRSASQAERNDLAVGLLRHAGAQAGLTIEDVRITFAGTDPIPLSWLLTEQQKDGISQAWESILASPATPHPLAKLDAWFPLRGAPPG